MTIRHIALLLQLGLLFPSSICLLAQTDSCTISWGDIIQISHDTSFSVVPQVVATGDTVHILWFGTTSGNGVGIQYSHSFDGGRTFSPQTQLVSYDSARGNRGFLATSGSYVYMVYSALVDSPAYTNSGILRSSDAGITWQPRIIIGDYARGAVAARDSSVYVYVNYSPSPGLLRGGLVASHDYGNSWSMVNGILPTSISSAIVATPTALHLVRARGVIGYQEVFYHRSTDLGFTWSVAETLSTNDGWNSQNVRLAGDDNSNLYSVWNDQKYGGDFSGTILMRRSTDGGLTWLPEQIMSQLATAGFCDVAVKGSTVAVAWDTEVSIDSGMVHVRTSFNGGGDLCAANLVSDLSRATGNPSIAIAHGQLHTCWFNYHVQPNAEIYYRRGTIGGPAAVDGETKLTPKGFHLEQNYPNPFNPNTVIKYQIPVSSNVSLKVYNVLGQEVVTLVNEELKPGRYEVRLDGSGLPSGSYFYRLQAGNFIETKKFVLLR